MKWSQPPTIKIYEALGAIADGRLREEEREIRVYSSSGNKYYVVQHDAEQNAIMTNDNGSYWKGYLGYPAIAYLMQQHVLSYNEQYGKALSGIAWKDINQQFKNDFEKTIKYCHDVIASHEINLNEYLTFVSQVEQEIKNLGINKLGKRATPPQGY